LKVAGVVEVHRFFSTIDTQPFKRVERPSGERESPEFENLLMPLGRLLNLFNALARQIEVFADLLKRHSLGAHSHHLGHLVD